MPSSDDRIPTTPLGIPMAPKTATPVQESAIASADAALAAAPRDVDLLMAAARAREPVWRYVEAVELYGRALDVAPDDWRLLVSRAHRLIRLRRLAEARADLERAAPLDPYGFNTAYLRALTEYLFGRFTEAADIYAGAMRLSADPDALALAAAGDVPGDPRHCMVIASDPHSRAAITAWRCRAERRAGRHDAARTIAAGMPLDDLPRTERFAYDASPIAPDDNTHYLWLVRYYAGAWSEPALHAAMDEADPQWSTVAYGVAAWRLGDAAEARSRGDAAASEANQAQARARLARIVAQPHWARLGHVAAEMDLLRLG